MKNYKEEHHQSAGKIIGEISRAAHIYFQNDFKEYSIGHAQVRTLNFIAHNEGITQVQLSDYLKLDKSSITSQLRILENNGYIKRKISHHDARVHQIFITDKTKEILEPLKNIFSTWSNVLLDGLSESEKKNVFLLLEKMRKNAQNKLQEIKQTSK